ncbi:MAG TPA: L-threonylcarbamoyladenylate synthase [Acidimicrobiales bacterium]|jgi:tRNA threonylcarbamoyl adenosine modification protein (Sua5/YciO/YrdC/YwlC family)|nr:L-threonylcarbamoyladenylate synthase [Acidimicrobiales bacterium]
MAVVDEAAAAEVLRAGNVVAIPTDTVYGLAADADQPGAVELLFELKQRPRDVNVPVLVADAAQAREQAIVAAPYVERLLERFWPGALTLVLDRHDLSGTVGLRCPDHAVPRDLCRRVGPLAVTSANLHGAPPLTSATAVLAQFGPSLAVVDGGVRGGEPSTVIDCTDGSGPVLLRAGAIPFAAILAAAAAR